MDSFQQRELDPETERMGFFERVDELRRRLLRQALRRSRGNMAAAGRELKLHRNTVIGYCDRMGIDPSAFEKRKKKP